MKKNQSNTRLIFLSNELLQRERREKLKLPLFFVQYARIEAKMYRYRRTTFLIPHGKNKRWGNDFVYGALFLLDSADFYIRQLDSYYGCSRSLLKTNHKKDMYHREVVMATPIFFDSLHDLGVMKYREGNELQVHCYFGNVSHRAFKKRIHSTTSRRVIEGIDKHSFKILYEEESHDKKKS